MIKQLTWPNPIGKQDGEFKLDRTYKALEILGEPQKQIKNIIHIGGTNGKGSTLAFLEKILLKASFTTFSYTSPSLLCLNERFKHNSINISDKLFSDSIDDVSERIKTVDSTLHSELTFFEGLTVLYFYIASSLQCDFHLLEVGLGGRYDATNVVQNPILSIITQVSLDHVEYLGNTHRLIALEKAEIMKNNSTTIIAKQEDNAVKDVFLQKSQALTNNNILLYDKDFNLEQINNDCFNLNVQGQLFTFANPSLQGLHQYFNVSNAILAAMQIAKILNIKSLTNAKLINDAITNTHWIARMQTVYHKDNIKVIVDGGHNQGAIKYIADKITQLHQSGVKVCILYSALRRKDIGQTTKEIANLVKTKIVEDVYITKIQSCEDSYDADEIAALIEDVKPIVKSNIKDCFADFVNKNQHHTKQSVLFIYGSLYLAANAIEFFASLGHCILIKP
jgi:dihydrofolate synthase / folylpolyglutamate synthase